MWACIRRWMWDTVGAAHYRGHTLLQARRSSIGRMGTAVIDRFGANGSAVIATGRVSAGRGMDRRFTREAGQALRLDCPRNREGGDGVARATRRLVLQRDNNRCTLCGSTSDLEVHHIVPRSEGGTNDPDNLVTLCAICHSDSHDRPLISPKRAADDSAPSTESEFQIG